VLQLEAQLSDRHVTIELTDEARSWLAERGYDKLYGARPLARVIQDTIKKGLAEELLFGKLVKGGHVKVRVENGKLAFDIDSSDAPAKSEEGESDGEAAGPVPEFVQ
jgi:ATP-dependent Clp protease ATP-binding subunit ClpA